MEDLISRQAAIKAIGKTSDELYENIKKGATFPQRQWFDGMAQAQSILENLPSALPETDEENELKFYYVESIDDYWIGQRLDNFYYADWHDGLGFVWSKSRYLPWGEHVVNKQTLWKEHTYPSEPKEIPFTMWIVGFLKKHSADRPRWIPVKWHTITDEEREREGYQKEWVTYLDCDMPTDEQDILVTTRWGTVEADVCYCDGEYSLDSGCDWIDDIVAWMPLPEPMERSRR